MSPPDPRPLPPNDDDDAALRALGALARESEPTDTYTPFSVEETDAVADAVFARLGLGAAPSAAPAAKVVAFPTARRPAIRWATGFGGLALAAGLAVAILRGGGPPAGAALPTYTLELVGAGAQSVRGPAGPSADRPRFRPGNTLTIVLRPAARVDAVPEVQVSYTPVDGAPRAFAPAIERDVSGALRLACRVGTPPLDTPGEGALSITLAPTGGAGGQTLVQNLTLLPENAP